MDNQEPQFLVINTCALWQKGVVEEEPPGIAISDAGIALARKDSYLCLDAIPLKVRPLALAIDPCGTFCILDADSGKVVLWDQGSGVADWVEGLALGGLGSIAVNDTDILIAETEAPLGRIRCLARANYQVRWEIVPKEVAAPKDTDINHPLGIAWGTGGEFYLLHRNQETDQGKLTRWRRPCGENYQPIWVNLSQHPGILRHPLQIANNQDGLFVLCAPDDSQRPYRVVKISIPLTGDLSLKETSLRLPADFTPTTFAVEKTGIFYFATGAAPEVLPVRLDETFTPEGTYLTKTLDSAIDGCQWHRLILESVLRENTRIELAFFASDEEMALPGQSGEWSRAFVNPTDLLISEARGRYIRFKIELFSDDLRKSSPSIASLKAEFPHRSYLRYLPALYQEDESSRDFLDRFLSIFESFFSDLEGEILAASRYLDAEGTGDQFLSWLSQWLALGSHENWPPAKVRALIQKAPRLYKLRGTRKGIEEMILLYADRRPFIVEQFLAAKTATATVCPPPPPLSRGFFPRRWGRSPKSRDPMARKNRFCWGNSCSAKSPFGSVSSCQITSTFVMRLTASRSPRPVSVLPWKAALTRTAWAPSSGSSRKRSRRIPASAS
jgi:phage tail-like protein